MSAPRQFAVTLSPYLAVHEGYLSTIHLAGTVRLAGRCEDRRAYRSAQNGTAGWIRFLAGRYERN